MKNTAIAVLIPLFLATPVLAQTRVGSVRQSPFQADTQRLYNERGDFIGTAREAPFHAGEVDLYDKTGRPTGIEVRPNAFDSQRDDVFDSHSDRE